MRRLNLSIGCGLPTRLPVLLRLESEVRGPRLPRSYRHFCRLCSILFLPRADGVVSGWNVVDGVVATVIGYRVGPLHDYMPAVHPGMNVALHRDGYLRMAPSGFDRRSTRGLGLVPSNVAASGRRKGVNVVRRLILSCHLKFLIDVHHHHVGTVHAALLSELRFCRRYRIGRTSAQAV